MGDEETQWILEMSRRLPWGSLLHRTGRRAQRSRVCACMVPCMYLHAAHTLCVLVFLMLFQITGLQNKKRERLLLLRLFRVFLGVSILFYSAVCMFCQVLLAQTAGLRACRRRRGGRRNALVLELWFDGCNLGTGRRRLWGRLYFSANSYRAVGDATHGCCLAPVAF